MDIALRQRRAYIFRNTYRSLPTSWVSDFRRPHPAGFLFAGPYERLIDRKFIPDPNYPDTKILPTENFNSEIKPRRQFFYNILITRQKREFEAPINNLFQDKNSSEEQTVGNNEVKGVKQEVVDNSDACLEIPQFGTKHSLNVSVTAGIVIWEFAKQLLIK